jgi:hypothetical protein
MRFVSEGLVYVHRNVRVCSQKRLERGRRKFSTNCELIIRAIMNIMTPKNMAREHVFHEVI